MRGRPKVYAAKTMPPEAVPDGARYGASKECHENSPHKLINATSFIRLPALIAFFAAATGLVSGSIAYMVAYGSYVALARERMEIVGMSGALPSSPVHDLRTAGFACVAPGLGNVYQGVIGGF